MVKKAEKAKRALAILEKQSEAFKDITEGIGKVAVSFATFGMFVVGFNAADRRWPVQYKVVKGLQGVVALRMAQSANVAASLLGCALIGGMFTKNYRRIGKSEPPTEEEIQEDKPFFKIHESYSYDVDGNISGKTTSLITSET